MDALHSKATTRAAPATSIARRVGASERLTVKHTVERQRAQTETIVVAWKLERSANGQELISLSNESSGDESAKQVASASASAEGGEWEDDGSGDYLKTESGDASQERKRKRSAVVIVDTSDDGDDDGNGDSGEDHGGRHAGPQAGGADKKQTTAAAARRQVIYSLDSDDDDDNDSDGSGGCEVVGTNVLEAHESTETHADDSGIQAFEFSHPTVDGDTTPETNGSSCGDSDGRYKSEATAAVSQAQTTASTSFAVVDDDAVTPADEVGELVPTVPRKAIPLMRRKKLNEEDAAFLLFYGISESPNAYILGLLVGALQA